MIAPLPANEHQRLERLRGLQLLDTLPEPAFDRITELAAATLQAPIALITLVDQDRQWFKSCVGLDVQQTDRSASFCAHALDAPELLVVPDAPQDPRFRHNPFVTGQPHVRFYAGAPLSTEPGVILGTLCVIDALPRPGLTPHQEKVLRRLAELVIAQILARAEHLRQLELERLHRDVVDNIAEVVFQTDPQGRWAYLNRAWEALTGHDVPASLGRSWLDFVHPDDRARSRERFTAVLRGDAETCRHELRHTSRDGALTWMELYARAQRDVHGHVTGASGTLRDVSAQKQAESVLRDQNADLERRVRSRTLALQRLNDQLRHDTLHDALTGLGNRSLFHRRLQEVLNRPRDGKPPSAVVLIDCDRFKQLNDTLGHSAGDDLLRQLARRLEAELPPPDLVTRLGGDEFALLLHEPRPDAAQIVEHGLRRVVERPMQVLGREWPLQVSAGVVVLQGQYSSVEEVVRDADIAMYRAKARSQDKVEVFEASMYEALAARTQLEGELRQALREGLISPHYQAIIRLSDGRVAGLEALARWQHPSRGLVQPPDFIPVAEESGLIVGLDRGLLEQACAQFSRWHTQEGIDPPLSLSVNVSPRQFLFPDFAAFVERTLCRTGMQARHLRLEITENLLLEETPTVLRNLAALRELGVQLDIDDFGTGSSSLAYVQRLSASALKIDRSLIRRIGQDGCGEALVRAVLEMARALGLEVIAEGVETDGQRRWLQAAGCPLGQGFLFSPPVDAHRVEALLRGGLSGCPVIDGET